MKILSINVNDFGGFLCRQEYIENNRWVDWVAVDKSQSASEILSIIQREDPTICALMEFELNGNQANEFIKTMALLDYELIPIEPHSYKAPSVTACFAKKNLLYEKLPNPHSQKTNKVLRASVIKVADYIIYFVHTSSKYDKDFWNEISAFYNNNKDKKVLIIGDLNLSKLGTPQKEEYFKLVSSGIKDVWLALGNSNATPTYINGARLDYALASPKMFSNIFNMRIESSIMNAQITDHAALIIEC